LPGEARADIGLVLVVALDDADVVALRRRAEILNRLMHAGDRGLAADVAIDTGEIAADADGQCFGSGGAGT
jgi:hypothetical protein